ncbi:MAG: hypothetical protein ACRDJW_15700 [Thermomicrobiales bacterium]
MDRDTRPLDEGKARDRDFGEPGVVNNESPGAGDALTLGTPTIAVWLAVVVALVGFFLLGRVTVHPDGFEREMRVADVWTEMTDELPGVTRQIVIEVVYFLAIAVTLAGSFVAILIALAARAPDAGVTHDPTVNHDGKATLDAPERGG